MPKRSSCVAACPWPAAAAPRSGGPDRRSRDDAAGLVGRAINRSKEDGALWSNGEASFIICSQTPEKCRCPLQPKETFSTERDFLNGKRLGGRKNRIEVVFSNNLIVEYDLA
jgi:hypothetical protein